MKAIVLANAAFTYLAHVIKIDFTYASTIYFLPYILNYHILNISFIIVFNTTIEILNKLPKHFLFNYTFSYKNNV